MRGVLITWAAAWPTITVLLFALVNYLSGRHSVRKDLTADQRYTVDKDTERFLGGLEQEGAEPVIIVWALANQIRTLYRLSRAVESGQPRGQALKSFRVWSRHIPMVNLALDRFGSDGWGAMLQQAAALDRIVKGRSKGSVWGGIERLCLAMCGIGCVKVSS